MVEAPGGGGRRGRVLFRGLDRQHLDGVEPSARRNFPEFDLELRAAMRKESELFLGHLFETNAPVSEIFSADYTFVDQRMARHYGIPHPGAEPNQWVRVELDGTGRRGFLTHASLMTSLATGIRPRAVDRGKWVYNRLLCMDIALPDELLADLPNIDDVGVDPNLSEREVVEQATSEGQDCTGCHSLLDPIGFGLGNLDSVGAWRDLDSRGKPVDATGLLPGYGDVDGALALGDALSQDPRLAPCATRQILTYALGRPVSSSVTGVDAHVDAIVRATASGGHGLQALVVEAVSSDLFTRLTPRTADP